MVSKYYKFSSLHRSYNPFGQKWQNCHQYKFISMFQLIVRQNYSLEFFIQGLIGRCYTFGWLFCWLIFCFVPHIGIFSGQKIEEVQIKFRCCWFSNNLFSKATCFNSFDKVSTEIFCYLWVSWKSGLLHVRSVFFAPHWRKLSQCDCVSCLQLGSNYISVFYNYWIHISSASLNVEPKKSNNSWPSYFQQTPRKPRSPNNMSIASLFVYKGI